MSAKIAEVDVRLYAVNVDAHRDKMVRYCLDKSSSGIELAGVPCIVPPGFLRISADPNVYPEPMPSGRALDKVGTWLCADAVSVVHETPPIIGLPS